MTRFGKDGDVLHCFLSCSCQSEVLYIEYDKSVEIADLCIYYYCPTSLGAKMSVYQRLRYCWRVIMTGKAFSDQMMMENKQLRDLKKFLDHIDL